MANATMCDRCGAPTVPFVCEGNRKVKVAVVGREQLCRECVLEEVTELLGHAEHERQAIGEEGEPCRI